MTLDDRIRAAVKEVRRSVSERPSVGPAEVQGFKRYRKRRQRNQRIGTILVAASLAIAAVFLVTRTFRAAETNRPAGPDSRNGRIVYGQWDAALEGIRLSTIDPDGANQQDLFGLTDAAVWSPDGSKILVTASAYAGGPLRPATINPDGSGFTLLGAVTDPLLNLGCTAWSPDGTRIACEGFNESGHQEVEGLYTVRTSDGGGLVRLTDFEASPGDYSPDGTRIVFFRWPNASPDLGALFVVNIDGTDRRRITPPSFASIVHSWSSDGRWIIFQHPPGQLFVVRPDGSGLHRLPLEIPVGSSARDPTWSPDGTMIAFSLVQNGQGDIYTVRADGTHLEQVTDTPDIDEQTPDWGRPP